MNKNCRIYVPKDYSRAFLFLSSLLTARFIERGEVSYTYKGHLSQQPSVRPSVDRTCPDRQMKAKKGFLSFRWAVVMLNKAREIILLTVSVGRKNNKPEWEPPKTLRSIFSECGSRSTSIIIRTHAK